MRCHCNHTIDDDLSLHSASIPFHILTVKATRPFHIPVISSLTTSRPPQIGRPTKGIRPLHELEVIEPSSRSVVQRLPSHGGTVGTSPRSKSTQGSVLGVFRQVKHRSIYMGIIYRHAFEFASLLAQHRRTRSPELIGVRIGIDLPALSRSVLLARYPRVPRSLSAGAVPRGPF